MKLVHFYLSAVAFVVVCDRWKRVEARPSVFPFPADDDSPRVSIPVLGKCARSGADPHKLLLNFKLLMVTF